MRSTTNSQSNRNDATVRQRQRHRNGIPNNSRSSATMKRDMTDRMANEKGDEVVVMHDHGDDNNTENNDNNMETVTAGILFAALPKWFDAAIVGTLIFGGCCGNVFALEAIIKDEPAAGPLITFVQFVTVSLFTIPSFLSWSAGASSFFMKAPVIPLRSWTIYTLFFVTVNLLNNWAFAYHISVPLHIILRSGGPTASMIIGYWYNGRRYSRMQIFSVMLLTLGVVAAALADAKAQGKAISLSSGGDGDKPTLTFVTGFTILALAMLLSAFQGVYADRLYATHGNTHWREALLYSHMLSLPFFLPTYAQLSSQFRAFMSSPSMLADLHPAAAGSVPQDLIAGNALNNATMAVSHHVAASISSAISPSSMVAAAAAATPSSLTAHSGNLLAQTSNSFTNILSASTDAMQRDLLTTILNKTPSKIFYLIVNALTQYICIRGVYLLAAKSSSLTVTIVLNIRKLVSLLLSIYIFGNSLAAGVLIGAGFVFLGGALYGVGSARAKSNKMNSASATTELHYRHNQERGAKRAGMSSLFSVAKNNLSSSSLGMRETSPTRSRKVKV
ncbi:UPD-GlcNAc transporter (Mnn2-2), putative [Talaromyces marneffei ATCC 18224]|uniref:UPD-GlcNAc transporter (Mnn2-2), putative n=1 Tax=Talaromyces marneffei (strain ATCC 18224 / CBS 334.59 / QM 7333) TaxID=441960 RepID=B6QMJ6_TALMQ|nr:UPD-GlcNAc transporter (Mnn2-2), putative [Talaromyces marneffei ATCC 18224]